MLSTTKIVFCLNIFYIISYHASRGEFGKEEQKLDEKILSQKFMANLNTSDDEWLKIDKRYNRALLKQYTVL